MQELISIIIPIYNVERFLRNCIDSLIKQTYQNWELFLVDDGSPDQCGKICDEYGERDQRIHVIHKENGGLSDARNCAIEKIHGEYLTFIDSDDCVHPDYLCKMLHFAQKYGADIVQCDFCRNIEDLGASASCTKKDATIIRGDDILKDYLHYRIPKVFACGKIYKSKMFKEIRYPIGLIDEDNFTTYKLMYDCDIFVNVNQNLYYYRINQESITNRGFDEKKFGILQSTNEIRRFLKDRTDSFDADVDYYDMRQLIQIYNNALIATAIEAYQEQFDEIYNKLCRYEKALHNLDMKYKGLLVILKFNRKLYNNIILWMRKSD